MPSTAKPKRPSRKAVEPRKSDLTRQRILDAAAKIFAQRGYGHTRLGDVALESDSHAGGIYYYFASREALVEEVLRACTMRSVDQMKEALGALPPDATAGQQLMVAATTQLAGIMGKDFYNLAFNRIYPQVPEDVRRRHQPVLREYFDIWRKIIRDGLDAGHIRGGIDSAVMRLTIVGSLQWAAEWASSSHGTPEALAKQMMSMFFYGILTPTGQLEIAPGAPDD
jgi:AcrR family transcriptional regulator